MKTLVMLELMPGDEYDAKLKCLLLARLQQECPDYTWAVASCAPGTVKEEFVDMAVEVDQRAQETINNHAAVEEGYVKCIYVALRSLTFIKRPHKDYELGMLLMVFKTREKVLRRFVVPDLEDSTPKHVLELFSKEVGKAYTTLPLTEASPNEEIISAKHADSVINAFADLSAFNMPLS